MAITFDGPNKLIILSTGTTSVSAIEIYSRWKEWVATSTNAKYLPAFQNSVGGDSLGAGVNLGSYFFIQNGWRIRPQEANHTLTISGNIFPVPDSFNFIANTIGSFVVQIQLARSSLTQSVSTSGGSGASVSDIVNGLLSAVIEGSITLKDSLKIANAVNAGRTNRTSPTSVVIKDIANSKNRISATMDTNRNRTNVTLDLSD